MGVAFTVELEVEHCSQCGIAFAVPADFQRRRLRLRDTFFCPAGHALHYLGEPEETTLRRERDRLKQALAQKDDEINEARAGWREAADTALAERRRANGYKGHATRITKRAKAGVCPCCNRTFAALAAHMKTEHPDFTPIEVGEAAP
jgi:hypothetical protein